MRQNPNQNPRQQGEQQHQQQQSTQQPPQQQPPQQQRGQPPQQQPPQQQHGQPPQQQPPQGQQPPQQQGRSQGQPAPPQMGSQQGGRPPQQPPQRSSGHSQQMPPSGGMQQGMSQQGQPPQGMQPGMGAQQQPQIGGQASQLQSVSLQDIVQEDVVTAEPDTPVPTITSQMKEKEVGAVVITEDNEPLGVVTDRKVATSLEEMPDISERTGEEVMSESLTLGKEDMTVHEAIQQLNSENIRRLPIVDDENNLVGIVTLDDIIVLLSEELQDSAEIIKHQSPRL